MLELVTLVFEDGIVFMLCVCMKSEDDGEKMMMMSFRVTH